VADWSVPTACPADSRAALQSRFSADLLLVLSLIDYLPLSDEVIAVGSVVEGLGNVLSDLDLYVLTENAGSARAANFYWLEAGCWVDVTVLQMDQLRDVVRRLHDPGRFSSVEWGEHKCIPWSSLDICHRLSIGVPLTDPLVPLRCQLDIDRAALAREVAMGYILPARARWLDAVGAMQSGHFGQAAYCAKIALDCAIDAYVALLGQTNTNEKWRLAKAIRAADPILEPSRRLLWSAEALAKGAHEQLIREAAEMIFHATHRFTMGYLRAYPAADGIGHRFEMRGSRLVRMDALGRYDDVSDLLDPLEHLPMRPDV
jgi:hypothetical protein